MFWTLADDDFQGKCQGVASPMIRRARLTFMRRNEADNRFGSEGKTEKPTKNGQTTAKPNPQTTRGPQRPSKPSKKAPPKLLRTTPAPTTTTSAPTTPDQEDVSDPPPEEMDNMTVSPIPDSSSTETPATEMPLTTDSAFTDVATVTLQPVASSAEI